MSRDAELLRCVAVLDERKRRGAEVLSRNPDGTVQPLAQDCANGAGDKSAHTTATQLGVSRAKIERARTVIDHADATTRAGRRSMRHCTRRRSTARWDAVERVAVTATLSNLGSPD